jgi:cell fate regulator YaaT (PSP1 superfamily)
MEKTNFLTEDSGLEEDIHISCDHSAEADKISANPFLTRGLCRPPAPEDDGSSLFSCRCCKLSTHNWLAHIPVCHKNEIRIVEIQFKNNHKEFMRLPETGTYTEGDIVVVEASNSADIGIITLTGEAVRLQMRNKKVEPGAAVKKVYRRARAADIEKWVASVNKEYDTMMRSRYIAWDLNLNMKVNDVEYQADGTRAVFYYSADERVDFRELIRILADTFHIRIEMKQIGVRQEAARLGGLGSCGRELCCAAWLSSFQSVSTNTARTQQLALNPQKLAGQCGKLKCCLNFEHEAYLEELKTFPDTHTVLQTEKGNAYCHKIDIFKRLMWFAYRKDPNRMLYAITTEKVKEIIAKNKHKMKIEQLEDYAEINLGDADMDSAFSTDDWDKIKD